MPMLPSLTERYWHLIPEQKRRSHYASAIARTAPSSKSSLNTSPTAIMTAIQALSTLLLHRAVDAQQPKHRPLPERYRHRIRAKATVTLCFSYSQDGIIIQIQPEHLIYSYNDGYTSSLLTATQALSSLTLGIVEGPCYVLPAGLAVGCFELSSSLRVTRAFLARYAALFFTMACMSLGLCEYCFHPVDPPRGFLSALPPPPPPPLFVLGGGP